MVYNGLILALVVVVVGLSAQINAQISGFYTSNDASALVKTATGIVGNSKSLKDIYHAVSYLKAAGIKDLDCKCNSVQDLLSKVTNAYDLYYASSIGNTCECNFKASPESVELARKESQKSDLHSIAGGVLALREFGALSTEEKTAALSRLLSLSTAGGTFKSRAEDSSSSVANVHTALEVIAALAGNNDGSELAADVFEKAFQLIPGSESGSGSAGTSDALLMVPLSKLTEKKLRLVGPRLVTVAEELLALKHSDDFATQVKVYDALKLVSVYKASPLHIDLARNTFESRNAADHQLKIAVHNILGEEVPVEAAEVVSVKAVGKEGTLFQGEKFVDGVLDMSAANLPAGRYLAQLMLTVAGRPKAASFQAYFVVTDQVAVNAVRFAVSEGRQEVPSMDMQPVIKQNSLDLTTINAVAGDKLQLNFNVASLSSPANTKKPHQAFVTLAHKATGRAVSFTAKKSGVAGANGALAYAVVLNVAELAAFDYQSGEYTVTIHVGDVTYAAPVEWLVGSVDLRFPAKQIAHLPLYAESLLHASDTTLAALPEITHVMRPPAKRASDFMATIFTSLSVAPLVVLVLFLLSLKPDLSRISSVSSLLALGCFTLLLTLYVSYWLSLQGVSFYETIKYLCMLTPVTMFLGSYALSSVEAKRIQQTEAATAKAKVE